MRAVLAAIVTMAAICGGGAPAPALPIVAPSAAAPPLLVPTRHHRHHWRRHYRYEDWSRYPPYGVPPESAAVGPGTDMPASEAGQGPGQGAGQQFSAAPAPTAPRRGGEPAGSARPSIRWVNPAPAGR